MAGSSASATSPTCKDGAEEARSAAFYNDEQAVGIDIVKSKGFSTTAVADDVRAAVDGIQRRLPAGTHAADRPRRRHARRGLGRATSRRR